MTLTRFILLFAIALQPVLVLQAGGTGVSEPTSVCCGDACNCCPDAACPCHEAPQHPAPAPPATPPAERVSAPSLFNLDSAPSYTIVPIEHRQVFWHTIDPRLGSEAPGDRLARLCLWLT